MSSISSSSSWFECSPFPSSLSTRGAIHSSLHKAIKMLSLTHNKLSIDEEQQDCDRMFMTNAYNSLFCEGVVYKFFYYQQQRLKGL